MLLSSCKSAAKPATNRFHRHVSAMSNRLDEVTGSEEKDQHGAKKEQVYSNAFNAAPRVICHTAVSLFGCRSFFDVWAKA